MIEAKEVAKYTGCELDFHICNALIKQQNKFPLNDGVSRSWIISEIRRATSISEYITPIEAAPGKVSRRLTALNKLNVIKNQKKGSNFKWFYNTGATLDSITQTDFTRNATVDVKVIKPSIVVTSVEAINPNKDKPKSTIMGKVNLTEYKPATKLEIVNNNPPRNLNVFYYFIRYKGLLDGRMQFQKSEFIETSFSIYTNDHKRQIEEQLLNKSYDIDDIKLILVNKV